MDAKPVDQRQPGNRKKWGLRTLGFLALALAGVLGSTYGSRNYILLMDLGVFIGLAGAAYCSYRGAKLSTWLPR